MKRHALAAALMLMTGYGTAQAQMPMPGNQMGPGASPGMGSPVSPSMDTQQLIVPTNPPARMQPMHPPTSPSSQQSFTMAPLQPTPDMWYYEQEKHDRMDPKTAVRRKAEFDTYQRQQRLSMMAWYGIVPSRPTLICTPSMGAALAPRVGGGGGNGGGGGQDIRHAGSGNTMGAVMIPGPTMSR